MPLKTPSTGQCAFCAFRATQWRPPMTAGGLVSKRSILSIRRLNNDRRKNDRNTKFVKRLPGANFRKPDHSLLYRLMKGNFASYQESLRNDQDGKSQLGKLGIKSIDDLDKLANKFSEQLKRAVEAERDGRLGSHDKTLYDEFSDAYEKGTLADEIRYAFNRHVIKRVTSNYETRMQMEIADMRHPLEWYPATRAIQRTIHLHVGPTNSGKTYHALKRLEEVETGIYAGPLRLLAHEVYSRLNAKNKHCALITGEERRFPEDMKNYLASCTVEMIPVNERVDVAVIDEIQMIGDPERGWAWTQALLGVKAKEVHLCGEARVVPLIKSLCAMMGDKVVVHEYKRLSPLHTMKKSLNGDLEKLQKGDCVIVFSRVGIHQMKNEIEAKTGKRCAIVYGSLPPETRAQQANLFNDPDNDYDILVASDAVGMGLNLSIKRVIFESLSKFNGHELRPLQISEVKQIAGRAGRYRTASQAIRTANAETSVTSPNDLETSEPVKHIKKSVGLVTTLEEFDMPYLQYCMTKEVGPLETAGIQPPTTIILKFAQRFPPNTPFSYILLRLKHYSKNHQLFHLCSIKQHIGIADAIESLDLSITDKIIFCSSPASLRDKGLERAMRAYARCVAEGNGCHILDIREINLELLDQPTNEGKDYLIGLETLHKAINLYLWLSYRFAGAFQSQDLAFHIKTLVEERIDQALSKVQLAPAARQASLERRRSAVLEQMSKDGIHLPTPEDIEQRMRDVPADSEVALPLSWEDEDKQEPLLEVPEDDPPVEAQL